MSQYKKGSYLARHLLKEGTEKPLEKLPSPLISPEKKAAFEDGRTLLLDKDLHWTSFDVVRKVRGAIKIKKVGHAGTLDPLASGLLIVCTGKHTKKINELMGLTKEYIGTITLGATTPTYDLESDPENFKDYKEVTMDALNAVLNKFSGEIMQRPPIYSAIKKEGKAAYELARRGTDIELEPRPITIFSFVWEKIELPVLHFKVEVSTGTYIRSLANDVGRELGCGAYLSSLRRTKVGSFTVTEAQTVAEFLTSLE